jgi:hypothetical protein
MPQWAEQWAEQATALRMLPPAEQADALRSEGVPQRAEQATETALHMPQPCTGMPQWAEQASALRWEGVLQPAVQARDIRWEERRTHHSLQVNHPNPNPNPHPNRNRSPNPNPNPNPDRWAGRSGAPTTHSR